jgi:DNA-binding transcriptional ArsR family regulator
MRDGPDISLIASLLGDPSRAGILTLLMSGQALTAGELAREIGVTAPTASGHLAQLRDCGLVAVEQQGRHRYYRLAGPDVAAAIEALMDLAATADKRRVRPGPRDPELRRARVCYDHLAGESGVRLFAALCDQEIVALDGGSVAVTAFGEHRLRDFGIPLTESGPSRRPLCRTCFDWSERKSHLAGLLGSQLLNRFYELGWAYLVKDTRIVRFTPRGDTEFHRFLRTRSGHQTISR